MRFFGGEVEVLNPAEYGEVLKDVGDEEKVAAAMAVGMKNCYELEKSDRSVWWANQMCNIHNALANRDTTGREILDQLEGRARAEYSWAQMETGIGDLRPSLQRLLLQAKNSSETVPCMSFNIKDSSLRDSQNDDAVTGTRSTRN
jgi:hypothetical protein